jgi:hypothetical protein
MIFHNRLFKNVLSTANMMVTFVNNVKYLYWCLTKTTEKSALAWHDEPFVTAINAAEISVRNDIR